MLSSLITSQTRVKLLKKFFLNNSIRSHLRGLESEFGESSNAIRVELNRFEKAGLLISERKGNKKIFHANSNHPLYNDIHSIILKETGLDKVVEKVIHRLGDLVCVYLTGEFARGKDSHTVELILVGDSIDKEYLSRKIKQAEEIVKRAITYILLDPQEADSYLKKFELSELLLLWNRDYNK